MNLVRRRELVQKLCHGLLQPLDLLVEGNFCLLLLYEARGYEITREGDMDRVF